MPSDIAVDDRKRVLRARMRAITRAIAGQPARRAERSADACRRLAALVDEHLVDRSGAGRDGRARLMVFGSWRTEVDLATFVTWCASRAIDVFVPAVDRDELHVMPGDLDPLALDVVVVPGLAFATDGRRLGRGGGHYDRLLRRVGPTCLRVGVAFTEQREDSIPTAPHDVSVDRVIWA